MFNDPSNQPPVLPSQAVKAEQPAGEAHLLSGFGGDISRAIASSYAWMALGLCLSAVLASISYFTGLWVFMYEYPMLYLILALAQIGVTIAFTVRLNRGSIASLRAMFLLYAALTGFTFSMILALYAPGAVMIAFLISAFYFGCLSMIGFTTRFNFEKIGPALIAGLVLMLVTQLILMLFRIPEYVRVCSFLGLLLFTGITIWDTQRMKKIMSACAGDDASVSRFSIYFALQLYLDFINIFLYILRLINAGSGSGRRS